MTNDDLEENGVRHATSPRTNRDPDKAVTSSVHKLFDTFRRARHNYARSETSDDNADEYNNRRAANHTANTALVRRLKGRHLQMIAIGGSIGTGLWIGTGRSLAIGGPGSVLIAYMAVGAVLYCTVQALGEMAALYPVAGSFAAFATRFLDPAWGFAMGWNYAMQWMVVVPLEFIAGLHTIRYWDALHHLPDAAVVTVFLIAVFGVNLCGVRAFGEAEFLASVIKASAVVGFILLGIIIDIAGDQDQDYIGGKYWSTPGAFNNGFKGFCSVLVTASFAFTGTELVGLAAAETLNPTKAVPTAVKQVFWRICMFYTLAVLVIGLIVRSDDARLLGNKHDTATSPFVIAIQDAGLAGLDSVMNAVILISVLSVANSSFFGSSRVLAALAEQRQAPKILAYVDRKGRPIVAVGIAAVVGLLAFMGTADIGGDVLMWLTALSGLSSIFTWGSICYAHIKFREAWRLKGHSLDELIYRSPVGVGGSWVGFCLLFLILVAQLWVAIDPILTADEIAAGGLTPAQRTSSFFAAYLAAPVVVLFYVYFKLVYKTKRLTPDKIDLDTGRYRVRGYTTNKEDMADWPLWKKLYRLLC